VAAPTGTADRTGMGPLSQAPIRSRPPDRHGPCGSSDSVDRSMQRQPKRQPVNRVRPSPKTHTTPSSARSREWWMRSHIDHPCREEWARGEPLTSGAVRNRSEPRILLGSPSNRVAEERLMPMAWTDTQCKREPRSCALQAIHGRRSMLPCGRRLTAVKPKSPVNPAHLAPVRSCSVAAWPQEKRSRGYASVFGQPMVLWRP